MKNKQKKDTKIEWFYLFKFNFEWHLVIKMTLVNIFFTFTYKFLKIVDNESIWTCHLRHDINQKTLVISNINIDKHKENK